MVSILFIYIYIFIQFSSRIEIRPLFDTNRFTELANISLLVVSTMFFVQRPAGAVLSGLRLAVTIAEAAALSAGRVVLADYVVCCCSGCCWSHVG